MYKNFTLSSRIFALFLAVVARLQHELSNFRRLLQDVNTTQKFHFPFSKLLIRSFRIQPQKNSPTFDKLNEIEKDR